MLIAATLALLLQCLYPSGYMPGSLSDGWIVKLCPDGLTREFVAQLSQTSVQPDHHRLHGHTQLHEQHEGHDGHEGHSTQGSCELGASFDQPSHLQADLCSEASLNETPTPLAPGRFLFAYERTGTSWTRAPPIA